jgi:hypothetical protein
VSPVPENGEAEAHNELVTWIKGSFDEIQLILTEISDLVMPSSIEQLIDKIKGFAEVAHQDRFATWSDRWRHYMNDRTREEHFDFEWHKVTNDVFFETWFPSSLPDLWKSYEEAFEETTRERYEKRVTELIIYSRILLENKFPYKSNEQKMTRDEIYRQLLEKESHNSIPLNSKLTQNAIPPRDPLAEEGRAGEHGPR